MEEQQSPKDKDMFWKLATGVLIVLLAFLVFKQSFTTSAPSVPTTGDAPQPSFVDVSEDDDPMLGDKNAPITIIEFSDFECPFCGKFHNEAFQDIKTKYIDTGKVNFVSRDFPLSFHQNAEPAAIAANCAFQQGKYWEMYDKIFTNQELLSEANLKKWAQEIGVDMSKWETCRKDPKVIEEITKDQNDGATAGVQGTPAFFVNGVPINGAMPFSAFEQVIEAQLK